MSRKESLAEKITSSLHPSHLEVEDESHNHSVPKGAESHFKVVVVAEAFDGLSAVRRHQLVYGAVSDEMKKGLHALAIVAKSPAEWAASAVVPPSPPCLGGSKAEEKAR